MKETQVRTKMEKKNENMKILKVESKDGRIIILFKLAYQMNIYIESQPKQT